MKNDIVFYSIVGGVALYFLGWFVELFGGERVYIEEVQESSVIQTYPYEE